MISIQTLYSDLVENVFYRDSIATLPPGGKFSLRSLRGKDYWYYSVRDGERQTRYIGKDTPEVRDWISKQKDVEKVNEACKRLTGMLARDGFAKPGIQMGNVLKSLSDAGFFRLRGVLVGTLAFQCYGPMLGEQCSNKNHLITMDVDIAQFHSIAVAIDENISPSFHEALSSAGVFEPVFPPLNEGKIVQWRDRNTQCVVDVLSPLVGKDRDYTLLPAIREHAIPLRFLDFLIYDEQRAVVLHRNGVGVNVPHPGRFGLHKIIVSAERKDLVKKQKDIMPAEFLCGHLLQYDKGGLKELCEEICDRGPGWRERLSKGLASMPDPVRSELMCLMPQSVSMKM